LAGAQAHLSAGFLQPVQTLFSMGRPHFLHGEHPQTWHMVLLLHSVPDLPNIIGAIT